MQKLAEETSGDKFNSCLLNLYHHGQEYMGWHSGKLVVQCSDRTLFHEAGAPNMNELKFSYCVSSGSSQ